MWYNMNICVCVNTCYIYVYTLLKYTKYTLCASIDPAALLYAPVDPTM